MVIVVVNCSLRGLRKEKERTDRHHIGSAPYYLFFILFSIHIRFQAPRRVYLGSKHSLKAM